MSPSPQNEVLTQEPEVFGNEVVISGMAGLYPDSRYIRDLENILYNKLNPITRDVRWSYSHPEAAQFTGSVPDLDRFDAQFFKVHFHLGSSMDSMSRKILEQAYEAIYDSGTNPEELSGKKVGVYIGSCFSETEKACFYVANKRNGFGIAGCSKAMFANRVSYWLNVKGPSHGIDSACCSSTVALEQAFEAISRGECEAAIVGGANLCLHPQSSVHYGRIMRLSPDGTTKCYDKEACGCAKSEAVNVLFLQKAKQARRIYARVVYAKSEYVKILDGKTGPKYGFYRNPEDTATFLKMFYDRAGIPPSVVEYVDGFGSAVPEVDKSELEAFDKIFCTDRREPLLVGSVMSNIGYGEAASGISAVTKVLLGYHKGELAGNLNCKSARTDVAAIADGRIKILNDHCRFRRTFAAVNSMSVSGVNGHVLLHGHYKPKDLNRYKSDIPYLVVMSGRQDSSVKRAFDELKSQPIDSEQLALLQKIHQSRINGHLGRGYAILDTQNGKTTCLSQQVDYYDDVKRPLWFVYSGMGSQWAGMGSDLMRIPIFAAAIQRCRKALEPKGIDIVNIITSSEKTTFDNILHSFVGIAAVQIGLTDVLKDLGLVPDNIIGHSVGELGCAYADGCLTAEEMILSAYSRGLVSLETPFIRGSMAAVGLGYKEMVKLCPPDIEIACHNSADSCTISGPADDMQSFVAQLVAKQIFAKEVPCSNIAYHSQYISKAGPVLLKYLKEVIKTPKPRSDKWLSTSVPKERWEEEAAKFSSAEYHTNNLLSPVLFEETSKLIPNNAVLVEIAPHGLLQAILKRSLPPNCNNIPLTRRGHPDNSRMVLEAVGKLYVAGFLPKVDVLYPKVEFPVSTGTPFLSNLVDWAHHEIWSLPLYAKARRLVSSSCKFLVSANDSESTYLSGNVINRQTMLPFSYVLAAAWDTLAMTLKVPKKQLNVQFRDCHFFAMPKMHNQSCAKLVVSIQRGSGQFEVTDGDFRLASGYINVLDSSNLSDNDDKFVKDDLDINSHDVYRLLQEKGYSYSGQFRSIHNCNELMTEANLKWDNNWVTFINGLAQLKILKNTNDTVSEVRHIRLLTVNVEKHMNFVRRINDIDIIKVVYDDDVTRSGGVIIKNMKLYDLPAPKDKIVDLKCLRFVQRFQTNIDNRSALQIFMQIVSENLNKDVVNVVGIQSSSELSELFRDMELVASFKIPKIKIQYQTVIKKTFSASSKMFEDVLKDADVLLINTSNANEIKHLIHCTRSNIFIIKKDSYNARNEQNNEVYKVISALSDKDSNSRLELAHVLPDVYVSTTSVIVRSEKDVPSLSATRNNLTSENSLMILTTYPPFHGLKSLVKQWRKDSTCNNINLVMVNDVKDTKQLSKLTGDFAFNILDKGIWGGVYYMPVTKKQGNHCNIGLQLKNKGHLNSFQWVNKPALIKSKALVQVHYAGINMNDVEIATGADPLQNEDKGFGLDFSGITESGERVMGLAHGTAQSHVVPHSELLWPVPPHWSLEDAATVPLAYVYAYYCVVIKNVPRMIHITESALVHGGSGALGQALISILLARGVEVFTTVSSQQKKKFLLRLFPRLKVENIGNSRDSTFVDMVLSGTKGTGCSLVVCCHKGEMKNLSLTCSSFSGNMVDLVHIQKHDMYNFGMYYLTEERTYTPIDISSIFRNHNTKELKQLRMLVSCGIASGEVRPLSRMTYPPGAVSRAFRLLAASQHRGRVLLRMDTRQTAETRLVCSEDEKHLIICDEQPLGTQIADVLISAGAKNIHLHIPKLSKYIQHKQRVWNKQNVHVSISSESLSDETSITHFLHDIFSRGPVHGIYLAADYCLHPTILPTFDQTVTKLSASLKHFFMLANGDHGAQFVAIKRAKEKLPATALNLSALDSFQDDDGNVWFHGIKDAIEKALLSSDPILLGQTEQRSCTKTLIEKILGLFELKFPKDCGNDITLEHLGIQQADVETIASFLRDECSISIDASNILSLSVQRVKELEERICGTKLEDVKGLGTFFSYVDPDELLATTEMVFLPTLSNNSIMRDDEVDVSQQFVCIVPGLEGHHERFRSLCERLKLPAIVLQPGLDHLHETVQQLAHRYSQVLMSRTGIRNNFLLLGSETGVFVALELAAILEQHGLTGTVFCMGDGIDETKAVMREHLRMYRNKEELQCALVKHMFTLMTGKAAKNIEGLSWKELVDTCVRTLLGHVPHSAQYARSQIESAYSRITTTIAYNTNLSPLKSKIVVLRAMSSHSNTPCTLQRLSQQPIVVKNVTVPLVHVTEDTRCASIINDHLPKELLAAFEVKNICETYLSNEDTFMTLNS